MFCSLWWSTRHPLIDSDTYAELLPDPGRDHWPRGGKTCETGYAQPATLPRAVRLENGRPNGDDNVRRRAVRYSRVVTMVSTGHKAHTIEHAQARRERTESLHRRLAVHQCVSDLWNCLPDRSQRSEHMPTIRARNK